MRHWMSAAAASVAMFLAFSAHADAPKPPPPAPVSALVRGIDIPYRQFTLDNGLRVIVHTDRKAPIVAVSVWYGVGSADEPPGKTGYAHLFEHLMFNGSQNYNGEFFVPLEEVGATDYNGTTDVDRTNYFQNVPTPALERALFLEADRMGKLLPALTQAKLDNQRGVVQNEKRQGDNEPYGLVEYVVTPALFPKGHPYHHTTIGSMEDLDRASLEDMRAWFTTHYGPNNAVLALAGDIDVETARSLVERHFGAIPRGPAAIEPTGGAPKRAGIERRVMRDRVANSRLYFYWTAPGRLSKESVDLDVAATILAGGASSRLHNALVRDAQVAIGVSGGVSPQRLASTVAIVVDVKPGVDPAQVEARVDAILSEFLKNGPTRDETQRVATRAVSGTIRGLEEVGGFGGKAVALAESALYAGDPGFWKRQLAWYAEASPRAVRAAARKWMAEGSLRLRVDPGERGPEELALAGAAIERPDAAPEAENANPDRSRLPPVVGEARLTLPPIERTTLSNGVQVIFSRRASVPVIAVRALFDAGTAADSRDKTGLQLLTLNTMREGTTSRTGRQIAEEAERLGAGLGSGFSADSTQFTVSALKPNFAASLALMADVVRNPSFPPEEVERLRAIQLARIAQEENAPSGLAARALRPLLLGPQHPYAAVSSLGTSASVKAITREDLIAFKRAWIRPDTMRLLVVGDTTLEEVKPQLEAYFGDWRPAEGAAKGEKRFTPPAPQGVNRILLIDRPNSPQSSIVAGAPLGLKGPSDPIALRIGNEVLGGAFTSRLNADLRESKGWSYGVGSGVSQAVEDLVFTVGAPVQADRTGDSIAAMKQQIAAFRTNRPPTAEELSRAVASNTLSLPGDFETAGALLGAIQTNLVLGRPDDYYTTLPARYRALTTETVASATRSAVDPDKLIWVVVGDAKVVEPQLKKLQMPYEVRPAAAAAAGR